MTTPSFPPHGATDCHTHLVGDPATYPMISPRAYTPASATPQDMRTMLARSNVSRVVVVQISVYGADNACMLDGMRTLGPCARGVVQVSAETTNAALDQMHAAGVRGIRANLSTAGISDPAEARRRLHNAAARCARNGWHLQVFTSPPVIEALADVLRNLPVPVVFDHFGLLPVSAREGPAERAMRDLLASGNAWVKISGSYRLDRPNDLGAIGALARDLYRANPKQIVWGSDWPHPPAHESQANQDPPPEPYRDIDPKCLLNSLQDWFANPADQHRILVDNPAQLYGFEA